ncbi:hypothetical protein OIU74_007563, partial [Salix koriyanagi]
MSMAKESI